MAGFIPDRVLEEIRFRNDIVEVIQGYLPLKRTGATYKACCPFHREKTPSFNVNPNMQIFKCFGCGEGGDVISFVMKHQGLDFMAAVRLLADRAGMAIETEDDGGQADHRRKLFAIHEGIAGFYRRCLQHYAGGAAARAYLAERELDGDVAAAFHIGYAPAGWDRALRWAEKHGYSADEMVEAGLVLHHREKDRYYDRFRDRLMFPVRDVQGRVVGFSGRYLQQGSDQPKYVNSPETALFNKSRILFGLDLARQTILREEGREAIIVEGQVDVIRCHQQGFSAAVAAQGTAFTDQHVTLLKRYADSAVLVYDADGAGQAAALKTAQALMRSGMIVRVAVLPEGEDPDSFLAGEGPEAFAVLLEGAVSTVAFQVTAMRASTHDGAGIAETTRAAKAVLETIACTPNAVQRDYLLREAADLLGLTVSALEADLEKAEQVHQHSPIRHAVQPTHDSQDAATFVSTDAKREDAPHKTVGIPAAERHLLQGLVHGDEAAWNLVSSHLVPSVFVHPVCRSLYILFRLAAEQGTDVDAVDADALQEDLYEQATRLLERLRRTPCIATGDLFEKFLQDAILRIWKQHFLLELQQLRDGDTSGDQAFVRENEIRHYLSYLKHWDTGQDVIATEMGVMGGSAGEAF